MTARFELSKTLAEFNFLSGSIPEQKYEFLNHSDYLTKSPHKIKACYFWLNIRKSS